MPRRASPPGSPRSRSPRRPCGGRAWSDDTARRGRHRCARRRRRGRAVPARRRGVAAHRRRVPVRHVRRERVGIVPPGLPRRGGSRDRRPAPARHRAARELHDVQHVGAGEPAARRGRGSRPRRRELRRQPHPRRRVGVARSRARGPAVSHDALKLTTYFGERDRADGGVLADRLVDLYGRHELETSILMRGVEGFGLKHHLRTDRLLTLSEDLPVVSVAVDTRDRIEAVLPAVVERFGKGLVTLERARLLTAPDLETPPATTKLTVYIGRAARVAQRPAYVAVVELLHRRGIAGATVLLGVD